MNISFDPVIFCLQRYGGISRYICEIATLLDAHDGVTARIVAPWHRNAHAAVPGVPVMGKDTQLSQFFSSPLMLANRVALWLRGERTRCDILHETYYLNRSMPIRARARVITVHDMIHEKFPAQFSALDDTTARKRRAVDRADHVICISQHTRNDLQELFGTPDHKITVVHHGHTLPAPRLALSSGDLTPAPAQRPFVLYVGQRDGYKNFDTLVRAFASSERLRKNFALVCFGGGAFSRTELSFISSSKLAEEVIQVGGDDSVLGGLYRTARAFVYPSRYEGFGLPPLEAMAAGCPVVCSQASSMPEVVGDAALMVDPGKHDEIAHALESVCMDDSVHARYVEKGSLRASLFTWDACARATLDVYNRLR